VVVHDKCVAQLANGKQVPADLDTRLREAINALRGETGPFLHEYWSQSIPGAIVETTEPRLYCYFNDFPDPTRGRLAGVFDAVDELQTVAQDSVRAPDRRAIIDMLTHVSSDVMGLLDAIGIASIKGTASLTAADIDAEVARISARTESARTFLARSVRRTSQFEYALFMGISVVAILVVALIVTLIAQPSGSQPWASPMAAAFLAGSLGAATSVLSKLDKAEHVSADSGLLAFRLFGLVRPIVGALFGAAVYVLLAGGLLPLRPASGIDPVYFYAGLGFLSGFVEGFATGLIARAAPVIGPPSKAP
jgi:hypothetical protein